MNVSIVPQTVTASAQAASEEVIINPQTVVVSADPDTLAVTLGNPIIREPIGGEPYEGSYTVTPSLETQTLPTSGKLLTRSVTINPIPSNYGLITWNGAVLTVS